MSLISPPGLLLGARKPQLEIAPAYATTYGPEVCVLMERAGQPLDPWQADAVCLMCAVKNDGRWACFEYCEWCARQNGKGGILEARVLGGLFLFGEKLMMWSAHEYKTAMEAYLRVKGLVGNLVKAGVVDPAVIKYLNTNGEEGIERLDTGQRLKFIARSKNSGRGFSGDLNIIDEAFAYERFMQAALMPTMSARPNPQIVYTSTPPLTGDTAEVMYRLRKRAEAGGDESLGYRDWGAGGTLDDIGRRDTTGKLLVDLDDPELWARTNPAWSIRISHDFTVNERRSMSDLDFARERISIWPKEIKKDGGDIDPEVWAALMDGMSKRVGDVALGVDIAPKRDYAAISVYGLREDELEHAELIDYRPGTDWLVERIVAWRMTLNPVAIAMGRGTYDSLKTELEEAGVKVSEDPEKPKRGELAVTMAADMAGACGQILDAVKYAKLRHKGQRELDASVAGARIRVMGDVVAWSRKDANADTCPIVSITVARWGFRTRVQKVVSTYDPLDNIW